MSERPAWSSGFAPGVLETFTPVLPLDGITREWAWGESTGAGVKVAVIDSGIDADHPAVGGVGGYVAVTDGPMGLLHDEEPHGDSYGHGTACAGIIRAFAPDCELYSVKVLGSRLTGRGTTFVAGLKWAIENGMDVCNISMGTTKKNFFAALHGLADRAYFQNTVLVTAANNMPTPSYPSLYSSVISVASHEETCDPYLYYYNPKPPVEFGAPGIDVRVAWADDGWITATGNSFAAPHITGVIAKILAKHPRISPFQIKTVLRATSANVDPGSGGER